MDNKLKQYKFVILGSRGHGKTTLHEALQKVMKDKNKKETKIYPDCIRGDAKISEIIPVLEQSETVILVISAIEGLNPQTREWALLSRQLGIENMVVYINKADRVNDKVLNEIQTELLDLMKNYDYGNDNLFVYVGSALNVVKNSLTDTDKEDYESIQKLLINL